LDITGSVSVTGNITVGNLIPAANVTYDLGSANRAWRDLYLSGSTIYLDEATITANATAMTFTTESGASFVIGGTGGNSTASFGSVEVTGNVDAAQVTATGNIDADRINANFFVGDGSQLTNVTATSNVAVTQIANGTTIMSIPVANDPVRVQVSGVSNVAVFTAAGTYFAGIVQATGNVTGGNLNTTGNINAANLNVTGNIFGTVNTSAPLVVSNTTPATSTTTGSFTVAGGMGVAGNIYAGGMIVATGNVESSGNLVAAGADVTALSASTAVFSTSVNTVSLTATGNAAVSGTVTVGNTLNVNGNASFVDTSVSGNANIAFLDIVSRVNVKASAQSTSTTTGAVIVLGGIGIGGNVTSGENVAATGNITGGNLVSSGSVSGNGRPLTSLNASNLDAGTVPSAQLTGTYNISITGSAATATTATTAATVTTAAQPNITSVGTLTSVTVTGNVTGGNLITSGVVSTTEIVKTGSNGVGNIGSATNYFNTVFAQATSAQYADLAEYYTADQLYEPGTVLRFGGDREVTVALHDHDVTVIGVVSTQPAYVMNSSVDSDTRVAVALAGRVPCRVTGRIRRGDMLVTAGRGEARAESSPRMGSVIGKALEDFDGVSGLIEIVVGRL
jgi:hypothetical protein